MKIQAGDILGYSGETLLSRIIRAGTFGSYSHVSIVAREPEHSSLVVFESTSQSSRPCVIQGESVSGVQAHHLSELVEYAGPVDHFPLAVPLDDMESILLSSWCDGELGSPYDLSDAWAARGTILGRLRNAVARLIGCASDDSEWQCADFCAAGLHSIHRYDRRPGHISPSALIRRLRRRGTHLGGRRLK